MLGNIIYVIVGCLMGIGLTMIYLKIINKNVRLDFIYWLIVIINSLLCLLFSCLNIKFLNTIFTLTTLFILFKHLDNGTKKFLRRVINLITIWGYGIIVDTLIIIIISILINVLQIKITNDILVQAIVGILMFLILYLSSKNKKIIKLFVLIERKLGSLTDCKILLFIIPILVYSFGILCFSNLYSLLTIINVCTLFLLSMSIVIFIVKYIDLQKNYKETIMFMKQNNMYYMDLINDYKIFKHNILNELFGVQTTANTETRKLIDDLICNHIDKTAQIDIFKIPKGVEGLVVQKMMQYNNENVNIVVNNELKNEIFQIISPNNYNKLCKYINIFLDNAFEALKKSKSKYLIVNFSENKTNLIVKIYNNFSTNNFCIDKIGLLNYSTKGEHRGYGLFSIIKQNYTKINYKIVNNVFIAKLEIRKNINCK